MHEARHWSGCPEAFREKIRCVKFVDLPGNGRQAVEYDLPVVWLAETEAHLVFRWRGKAVDKGCTYNDFYGFCRSIQCLIGDEAAKYAEHFDARPGDEFSVEIDLELKLVPYRGDRLGEPWKGPGWKKCYLEIPNDVYQLLVGPVEHEDFVFPLRRRVERFDVAAWNRIWTSADPDGSTARVEALIAELKARYPDPEPKPEPVASAAESE